MRTTLDAGETYDFGTRDERPTYVHYLKGSNIANNGPALTEALRAVDVMESTTIMSGTGDFGFENEGDSFVHIRSGATLRKQGENTVTVPRSPISNNGTMLIEDGTLLLEDGTQRPDQATRGSTATARWQRPEESVVTMSRSCNHSRSTGAPFTCKTALY